MPRKKKEVQEEQPPLPVETGTVTIGNLTEQEKKDIAEVESWGEDNSLNIKAGMTIEDWNKTVGSQGDGMVEVLIKEPDGKTYKTEISESQVIFSKPWEKWQKPKEEINEVGVEIQGKPNPEVEMILLNGKHFYKTTDETTPYYVSVTTILSALAKGKGFDIWQSTHTREEQQDILDETSLRGSKVHRAIQLLTNGQTILPEDFTYTDDNGKIHTGLTNDEKRILKSFVAWWYKYSPKVYAVEKIVYNTTYKYAGTLDLIATIKHGLLYPKSKTPDQEVLIIIDHKTSSGIWPSYEMQLAAYAVGEYQISSIKIEAAAILRLGTKHKNGGYEFKLIDSIADSFKAFLGVLEAWNYLNPNFKPVFEELPKSFKLPPINQVIFKDEKQTEEMQGLQKVNSETEKELPLETLPKKDLLLK